MTASPPGPPEEVSPLASDLPPAKTAASSAIPKRAGMISLFALLYASTCGGPYGTEDYVARIGPGAYLLLLFVTPWLYGIPLAFSTAELSSRRSIEGGYYRWAQHYLGEFWGFQTGAWSVLSSVLDNALYPILFASAIRHFAPQMSDFHQWLVAVAFILVFTYVNYRGIEVAGSTAAALNLFLVAPLFWLVIAAAFRIRFNPFVPFTAPGNDAGAELGTGLALSMWLYSGYDEVSTAAGEIEEPAKRIPRALFLMTPLVVLSYSLPAIAGLASVGGWERWTSGQFASMGEVLGGHALRDWVFLASVASQSVIFLAYMLWCSRVVWAMAVDGWLPRGLAALHRRHGTPYRILLLSAVCNSVLAALPFKDVLVADIWLAGAYTLLIHASVVASRRTEEPMPGAFRIPGGRVGLALNVTVPFATWIVLLVTTSHDYLFLKLGLLLAGPLGYLIFRRMRVLPA